MRLIRFPNIGAFRGAAEPFLLQREAEHGLMLGIMGSTTALPDGALAAVLAPDGADEAHAAAIRFDTRLIVSWAQSPDSVAGPLRNEPCSAVLGSTASVEAVVAAMRRPVARSLAQGIYECRRVVPPAAPACGTRRLAEPSDEDTLIPWHIALSADIGVSESREHAAESIRARTAGGALHVWDDAGRIVSCAAAVGPTPRGIRVNFVYTPPDLRGRGYASALVADLTQTLLDGGRDFVFLHTDLANPISNRLYQRLGYERAGDFMMAALSTPRECA